MTFTFSTEKFESPMSWRLVRGGHHTSSCGDDSYDVLFIEKPVDRWIVKLNGETILRDRAGYEGETRYFWSINKAKVYCHERHYGSPGFDELTDSLQ
jgi:hypothetical protein